MRAGCELDRVRRHSGCPAVDEHTRSGGIGGHAQRGGPAGPLGQRDVHDDGPARLDVQLLLGDASDVLAAAELLQIVKVDQRHRCECIHDIHMQVVAEQDRCVTAGRRPATECLPDMR